MSQSIQIKLMNEPSGSMEHGWVDKAELQALILTPRCPECRHSELFHDYVYGTSDCRVPDCTCARG